MPTTIRTRHLAANRGQADDHRIARGQIALVDALTGRLSRLRDRCLAIPFGAAAPIRRGQPFGAPPSSSVAIRRRASR